MAFGGGMSISGTELRGAAQVLLGICMAWSRARSHHCPSTVLFSDDGWRNIFPWMWLSLPCAAGAGCLGQDRAAQGQSWCLSDGSAVIFVFLELELPDLDHVLQRVAWGSFCKAWPCVPWLAADGQVGHGRRLISSVGKGCAPPAVCEVRAILVGVDA